MLSQTLEPQVVKLDAGAAGGWIGSPRAKEVLLYFYGMFASVTVAREAD